MDGWRRLVHRCHACPGAKPRRFTVSGPTSMLVASTMQPGETALRTICSAAFGSSPTTIQSDQARSPLGPTVMLVVTRTRVAAVIPSIWRVNGERQTKRHAATGAASYNQLNNPNGARACTHKRAAHSITSSARARSDCGTVRPSALAVLRLMTSSILLGCWIGSSPGFSPLRMRPV